MTIDKSQLKAKYCLYIFILALIFRVFIINVANTDKIAPDGIGYYRLAYNLAEGNGYTSKNGEKYFFREPGYPIFLSLAFQITKLAGFETGTLKFDNSFRLNNDVPEITVAKYMQAILDSLTCVLLFLIFSSVIKNRFAFIISVIFCFYFPYAYHTTSILREVLQAFLAISLCYTLLQYFLKDKIIYLIFTGFLLGLLNLTFQVSVVFLVSIPIFIWVFKKSFIKAIVPSLIIVMIMLLTASPWLCRTYNDYPDWRIVKSFGTSFTPELRNWGYSVLNAEYFGLITEKEMNDIHREEWYGLTDDEKFKLSLDGTFTKKADSINALIDEPLISKRKLKNYGAYFFRAWFAYPSYLPAALLNQEGVMGRELIKKYPIYTALLMLPVFIIGFFAFLGLLIYFRKFFIINIIFITFMSVFFLIANEPRRMLPAIPFIFLYGIMGMIYCYYRFIRHKKNSEIDLLLLK